MYDKFYLEGNWYLTKDSDDVKRVYLKTKSKQEAKYFYNRLAKVVVIKNNCGLGKNGMQYDYNDYAKMQAAAFRQRNIVNSQAVKTAFSVTGQTMTQAERGAIYAQSQLSGPSSIGGAW